MATLPYRTALIIGAGPGISASVARHLATEGLKVALAARDTAKLADIVPRDWSRGVRRRCDRSRGGREPVPVSRRAPRRARCRHLQREHAGAGTTFGAGPRGGPAIPTGFCVRGISGGATGCPAHGAEGPGRHPADGRVGQRQRFRAIGGLRHGQVRAARASRRAPRGSWDRGASTSRISTSTAVCGAPGVLTPPTGPTAR